MAEPEVLLQYLQDFFRKDDRFSDKTVLITAGPTYEAIDPVRFIGNHSSGKMGFALAEAVAAKGGKVILVTGPTHLKTDHKQIRVLKVTSARDMLEAVQNNWDQADLGIFASAVADYRPETPENQKIKKTEEQLQIILEKNPDILSWASAHRNKQKVVGFALETQNGLDYAKGKLEKKNLDAIVLNEIGEPGIGFGTDTNSVKLLFKNNKMRSFELQSKQELAFSLLNELMNNLYE
ncbi:Coenzyme A biosynthesis bifunctional protein CoaBC [compost metagenome]